MTQKNKEWKSNIPLNFCLELFINIIYKYEFFYIFFSYINIKFNSLLSCYIFRKIMKISKDERANIRNMPVGMSKKVYKEMVKEMDKIASHEETFNNNVLQM